MSTTLWVHDNGEVTCARHAGHYLRAALAADPQGVWHRTPLGSWEQVDEDLHEEHELATGHRLQCEQCPPPVCAEHGEVNCECSGRP